MSVNILKARFNYSIQKGLTELPGVNKRVSVLVSLQKIHTWISWIEFKIAQKPLKSVCVCCVLLAVTAPPLPLPCPGKLWCQHVYSLFFSELINKRIKSLGRVTAVSCGRGSSSSAHMTTHTRTHTHTHTHTHTPKQEVLPSPDTSVRLVWDSWGQQKINKWQ